MAKRKGGKSKGYISKGGCPSVNKKLRNAIRKERIPTPTSMAQSVAFREKIIKSPKTPEERILKKKFEKDDEIITEASRLWNNFRVAGMTWAAAVQAVKTEKTEEIKTAWQKRFRAWVKQQEKEKKLSPLEVLAYEMTS